MCDFLCWYRSPTTSWNNSKTSTDNFELTLDALINENRLLINVLGYFNAKATTYYSSKIKAITSQYGLQ